MREVKEEITREMYTNYMARPKKEWRAEIEKTIPAAWVCGYGYYGTDLVARDGKYYLIHCIGDSCD